ncbi:phosphoenolpyruvate--protein phosphotransferase [Streptomyces ipomoeae]|uniref:phosphoenolpyruvate--protein phosphotransferase n=1 Tax=Streptomyces ipomoeae TaxID=103232 RepID=UPI0011474FBD|nr:phosphoenolpyruvate--protein phosphotransferase [Streptomyces ipomoeae]MDX2933441.1 phosphoenolpyruvate--protein phosphotransferase [Streptomyces ipomoeae]TQE20291.1 phosphoenolpyruvate--protein phosphotransferase [Streptomyces ipomoeae]
MTTDSAVTPRVLTGLGVSPGTVAGPVARLGLPPRPPVDERPDTDVEAEVQRVTEALETVARGLEERAARAGGQAAEILSAAALMARDPSVLAAVRDRLEAGRPTAAGVDAAFEQYCDLLARAGGYLAERVADLRDVRDRVLAVLLGEPMPGLPHPGHPYVLVARDLSPADTAVLDPAEVLALVTEKGGPTSHTAILASGLGIPAVVRCANVLDLSEGSQVLVDGVSGEVTAAPGEETVRAARSRADARRRLAASAHGPGRTADGVPVALLANVATVEDAQRAAKADCEGIGLFRTEGLYLDRVTAPSQDEQQTAYTEVFAAFTGRRVVVRTLDAGADKPLAFIPHEPEENPALGVRGYRVSRHTPDLLDTQLAALGAAARATGADVRVMAPMISTPAEAKAFTDAVRQAGLPVAGAMIEVPAAALRARQLMRHTDFVSIGTNDLTQYTFAADRLLGTLADLLDPWQPALLQLIREVGEAGTATGTPVGVCGTAAGDPLLACVLVGLGVRSLSMPATLLADVRAALAHHTLASCARMAERALDAEDATAARAAVRELASPEVLGLL